MWGNIHFNPVYVYVDFPPVQICAYSNRHKMNNMRLSGFFNYMPLSKNSVDSDQLANALIQKAKRQYFSDSIINSKEPKHLLKQFCSMVDS